jgi:GntR family transcriptional repressor for pyruvate dehydrogenase complex
VREALSILQGQGLVELHHGDGTYIRTATMETWMQPLDAALLLAVEQLEHVVGLVLAVLASAAGHLAQNCDADRLSSLNQRLFQMECFGGQGEESVSAELAFHLAVAEASGNTLTTNVVRVMEEAFRSCLRLTHQDGYLGLETCRAVVDAIAKGRSGVAREALFTYGDNMVRLLVWLRESAQSRADGGRD